MCLAIPAKIIEVNGNNAVAEVSRVKRDIRIDLIEDCKVGDHVLLHAGFAINKLDEEALRETNQALAELEKSLSS
jgi:hydrogenase expression/formation protein HypC